MTYYSDFVIIPSFKLNEEKFYGLAKFSYFNFGYTKPSHLYCCNIICFLWELKNRDIFLSLGDDKL